MLAFLLSKIPEMFDTVLIVLQKKPLIFLHWYHHMTVSIFCWYAGRSLISSGIYFATMNYCVHAVMYSYYLCCSLGLRRLVRPLAPLITGAQLLQMLVGTAVVVYTWYHSYISGRGCDVDRRTIRMGIAMYGSYVVLFALLFARLYLTKSTKKDSTKLRTNSSKNKNNNKNNSQGAVVATAATNGKETNGKAKDEKRKQK
ncbi:fatty acid elongase [Strigomonas culicis]|nr:fatty acid elongase [Strigomonas culicis]EPY35286.1 fatty acid elongase [Strigomonas culicis]|eukprot:EPY34300.1 fatty acid elongase [Strigomonas culicis]